jgi:hypothetical protein
MSNWASLTKTTEVHAPPGLRYGQHAIRVPFEFNHIHSEGKNLGASGND